MEHMSSGAVTSESVSTEEQHMRHIEQDERAERVSLQIPPHKQNTEAEICHNTFNF